MKSLISGMFATGLAVATALAGLMPAGAAPLSRAPIAAPASSDVQLVQLSERERQRIRRAERRADRIEDRLERRAERRADRREDRRERRFERRGDGYYYGGYRGYRERRPGYRYYNGYYFPAGAFLAGAIISGAIANSARPATGGGHVDWCYDRYRSYRASDNTYQPLSGPRRECFSPYS